MEIFLLFEIFEIKNFLLGRDFSSRKEKKKKVRQTDDEKSTNRG
jgi:hypothetical protein